jgi:hypothetical protein
MKELFMNLLDLLKSRFDKNPNFHSNMNWDTVAPLLTPSILKQVETLESTLGEPHIVVYEGSLYIVDMSKESPKGRVSGCYDEKARKERVKFPPETSALGLCEAWGVSLVDEAMYRHLQTLQPLDQKTSTWILTPEPIRALGGALFMDRRYQTVFVYHNGADSYYGSRGFRTYIKLNS